MTDVKTHVSIKKSWCVRSGKYSVLMETDIPRDIDADYVLELTDFKTRAKDKLIIKDKDMLIGLHKVIGKYLESLK